MENLQLQNFRRSRIVKTILLVTCLSISFSVNCTNNSDQSGETPTITVEELRLLADFADDFFLLDVRTEPEYIAGRLAFSDLLIPYDSLSAHLDMLPQDKTAKILCFCRTGRRSGISTRYLKSIGYENVYNVAGGIVAWQKMEQEIIKGKPQTSD